VALYFLLSISQFQHIIKMIFVVCFKTPIKTKWYWQFPFFYFLIAKNGWICDSRLFFFQRMYARHSTLRREFHFVQNFGTFFTKIYWLDVLLILHNPFFIQKKFRFISNSCLCRDEISSRRSIIFNFWCCIGWNQCRVV
jgi:hypothetical protein